MKQRTIRNTIRIEGVGLQTGNKVSLILKSSPENSGISFIRTDLAEKPLLNLRSIEFGAGGTAERRTTVGLGPMQIQTTEHLLAALAGIGIDNIVIEMNNVELPGLDGSAKGFLNSIKKAGIAEQNEEKKFLDLKSPLWCSSGDSFLAIFPDECFSVTYMLSYPGIGTHLFNAMIDEKYFEKEIAPARTFCSQAEAMELLKRGLGKGANYDNTLVMGPNGPINNTLRFTDEPLRHKVLDLMGDLYLAGRPVKGRVIAVKSGHKLNMELVGKLRSQKISR
ncbi:MAG: UDP-3-O-[3-hydroxymyristoyl] N-acetylglucosamine deacetylase [Candidatus Omnitrophica bacterium]|nr:UDP-3-O-[3-hydroxymyristoyl] N-acetylglucosamine deacetylase [Candidatus Omnitrophota bacterium]